MANRWTPAQQQAIDLHGRNLLVAAAAGSGKTAVLVERIIQIITGENPVDVDRLLVLTFTRAAAAEMKERIGGRLNRLLGEHPGDEHLGRQAALLDHASITTIDSFCLRVVKDYFGELDLDPDFRIGDEGELTLLRADCMEELLEAFYEEGDPDFLDFAEAYGGSKSDYLLETYIQKVYDFSQSCPYPEDWLKDAGAVFQVESVQELDQLPFMVFLKEYYGRLLEELEERAAFLLQICQEPDGPAAYEEMMQSDLSQLSNLRKTVEEEGLRALCSKAGSIRFARKSTKKQKDASEHKKQMVSAGRDELKDVLKKNMEYLSEMDDSEILESIQGIRTPMHVLLKLTRAFGERYREAKTEKNILDFNDLEHLALSILVKKGEGRTDAARELEQQYKEILVDEYQDSNFLQDMILDSISGREQGMPNMFMVGDVKQSIYRFRMARPEIFMGKYREYSIEDSLYQKIDLQKNFRSRSEVLEGINRVFRRIMTPALGDICYDDAAALYPGASYPVWNPVNKAADYVLKSIDETENRVLKLIDKTVDCAAEAMDKTMDCAAEAMDKTTDCAAEAMDKTTDCAAEAMDKTTDCTAETTENAGDTDKEENNRQNSGFITDEEHKALKLVLIDMDKKSVTDYLTSHEMEGNLDSAAAEAYAAAAEIRRIIDSEKGQMVLDKESGTYHRASYRDIVILLRSMSGKAETWLDVLTAEGIPACAPASGYFDALEVRVILSLLQIIDNPVQDIPLAAVMKSPIGGFQAAELAEIRAVYQNGLVGLGAEGNKRESLAEDTDIVFTKESERFETEAISVGDSAATAESGLYYALLYYINQGDRRSDQDDIPSSCGDRPFNQENVLSDRWKKCDDSDTACLREKVRTFLRRLDGYREKAVYLRVHELISYLYQDTGYYDYVSAMPAGMVRRMNLDMLAEKALSYEKTSYHGLFHFVRYLEHLKKYEVDFEQGQAFGEQDDIVRIYSIHKSKGLEYPIVILGGLARKFNQMDSRSGILLHPDLGIAADYINVEKRYSMPTAAATAIAQKLKLDTLGEELRILYVAMTRARESLIMTAADPWLQNHLEICERQAYDGRPLPFYKLISAGSYLDWIMMAAGDELKNWMEVRICQIPELLAEPTVHQAENLQLLDQLRREGEKCRRTEGNDADRDTVYEIHTGNQKTADRILAGSQKAESSIPVWDPETADRLQLMADQSYPYEEALQIQIKFSVSELKRQSALTEEEKAEDTGYLLPELMPQIDIDCVPEENSISETASGQGADDISKLVVKQEIDDIAESVVKQEIDDIAESVAKQETSGIVESIQSQEINGASGAAQSQGTHGASESAQSQGTDDISESDTRQRIDGVLSADSTIETETEKTAKNKLAGSERGTAFHRVLELLPPDHTWHTKEIESQIQDMISSGRIRAEAAASVSPWKLYTLYQSPLGKRIQAAYKKQLLYREQSFIMQISACEINQGWSCGEPVLIQGIIDCFFEENGKLILVDYKTDGNVTEEILVQRYHRQFELYQRALEQITGKMVGEKYIWSFSLNQAVPMP